MIPWLFQTLIFLSVTTADHTCFWTLQLNAPNLTKLSDPPIGKYPVACNDVQTYQVQAVPGANVVRIWENELAVWTGRSEGVGGLTDIRGRAETVVLVEIARVAKKQ